MADLPTHPSGPELRTLNAAKRMARSLQDIHGVDFGFAYVGGEMTDRRSVRFHTRNKKPVTELPPDQRLPETINGVDVDVMACGYMLHDGSARSAQDVLQPGISIGNVNTKTTGTLGLFVQDPASRQVFMLSNWHVLCGGPEAAVGDGISQPGPFDLGSNPARPVAQLERWVRLSEQYDAALAMVLPGTKLNQELFNTTSKITGIAAPALGQRVIKSGAVSGITHAIIDGIAGSYRLDYTGFGESLEWMAGFHLVEDPNSPSKALSLEGDSGSLWVDSAGQNAVGLHFAGEDAVSPLNQYALAHPIADVLERLAVTLAQVE